jgi:hypothetical protein
MILTLTHGVKYGAKKNHGNTCASIIQASISIAGLRAVLTASRPLFPQFIDPTVSPSFPIPGSNCPLKP